jgi:hypothetical protein
MQTRTSSGGQWPASYDQPKRLTSWQLRLPTRDGLTVTQDCEGQVCSSTFRVVRQLAPVARSAEDGGSRAVVRWPFAHRTLTASLRTTPPAVVNASRRQRTSNAVCCRLNALFRVQLGQRRCRPTATSWVHVL